LLKIRSGEIMQDNRAILFDIDDTLIPTSDFIENVLYHSIIAMINTGLPENDPYKALQKLHEIRKNKRVSELDFNLLCYDYGITDKNIIDAGVKRYRLIKLASLQTNINLRSTLEYLIKKGYKLGIVTTGPPEKQIDKLQVIGLDHYFKDCFFASKDVSEIKPNPVLYQKALKKLNADPKKSYYVGNRLDIDIKGAHNAGMKGILLLCGKYAGQNPVSLLLQKGVSAEDILSGKHDVEIKSLMPEYSISNFNEIKKIL